MAWTRITDPEQAAGAMPIWFVTRMIGLRGRFGLVLTSGDILRITSITALHELPHGVILLDVLLDHAGFPTASIKHGGRNIILAHLCPAQ